MDVPRGGALPTSLSEARALPGEAVPVAPLARPPRTARPPGRPQRSEEGSRPRPPPRSPFVTISPDSILQGGQRPGVGNAESRNAGCQYEPGHVERVFVHGEPLRDAAIPWPERVQAAAPSLEKAALPFYEACRSPKGRSIANFSRTVRDNPPSLLFPSLPPPSACLCGTEAVRAGPAS